MKKKNVSIFTSSVIIGLIFVAIVVLMHGIGMDEVRNKGIVCDRHTVTRKVGPAIVSKCITVFRLDDGTYVLSDDPMVSELCKDAVEIEFVETYTTFFGTYPHASKSCKIVVGKQARLFEPKIYY